MHVRRPLFGSCRVRVIAVPASWWTKKWKTGSRMGRTIASTGRVNGFRPQLRTERQEEPFETSIQSPVPQTAGPGLSQNFGNLSRQACSRSADRGLSDTVSLSWPVRYGALVRLEDNDWFN